MPIPDDVNIDCPHQRVGMGYLRCRAADTSRGTSSTNEVTEEICYNCDAGKIFREVGCDQFMPQTWIIEAGELRKGKHLMFDLQRIFCTKRKRETTLEYCQSCSLVTSPETERIFNSARTFFEANEFLSTQRHLKNGKRELTINNNPDGCIRASVSSLESTLKIIHDRLGVDYPKKEQLTELWGSIKSHLNLGDEISSPKMLQMIGSLTGAAGALASMRNDLSDAHGEGEISEEVYESYAELSLNLSATLSTFLIRRWIEINHDDSGGLE